MARFGMSGSPLFRRAGELGLRKSAWYRADLMRARRTHIRVRQGPDHPNWRGGRPWERFASDQYRAWRLAVLQRDKYICQECGRQCKPRERGLAAHHIQPYATYPDLRYDVNNGRTLCRACHMALHGRPIQPPELIPCACGCGTMILSRDIYHKRPRRFVNHHASRGIVRSPEYRARSSAARKGRPLTPEHRAKIKAGLLARRHQPD